MRPIWIGGVAAASLLAALALHQVSGVPLDFAPAPAPLPPVEGCPPPAPGQAAIVFPRGEVVPVCADVYVEPGLTAEERDFLRRGYAEAAGLVASALGPLRAEPPLVIFCKNDPCQMYFTGPTRRSWSLPPGERRKGATFVAGDRHTIIVNDIDTKGIGVAAHEITHVEFRARRRGQLIPAWFNEGAATWVGGAPECADDVPDGIEDLGLVESSAAWNEYTDDFEKIHTTYCQARREVDAWIRHRDVTALARLLDAVGDGEAFEDVYGDMMTQ